MRFEKGHQKVGGKQKGTENKTTRDIKEAYRMLIENNLDNMTKWLSDIAIKDPAKAIFIIADLTEYVIPKLARTDSNINIHDDTKALDALTQFEKACKEKAEKLKNEKNSPETSA